MCMHMCIMCMHMCIMCMHMCRVIDRAAQLGLEQLIFAPRSRPQECPGPQQPACMRRNPPPQKPTRLLKAPLACEGETPSQLGCRGEAAAAPWCPPKVADFHLPFDGLRPRNSDVSSRANNTDAWGWEQLLWFGMGQRLRLGLWAPGQPLPASLLEMLEHFRRRGVRPIAYVYPILAFLAHTLPGGASPPWIVNGTYYAAASTASNSTAPAFASAAVPHAPAAAPRVAAAPHAAPLVGAGPLRSDLASPALQRWLPHTLLAFANATGAGGFSFDYTYFEQGALGGRPWEPQLAQWAGWRTILARLQVERGCAGQQCVVDNRQANHAAGPWMWAQGGTYAEPLQGDEQPGSWMFYEADLHTDRLSANRQRETAWSYRVDEYAGLPLEPFTGRADPPAPLRLGPRLMRFGRDLICDLVAAGSLRRSSCRASRCTRQTGTSPRQRQPRRPPRAPAAAPPPRAAGTSTYSATATRCSRP